MSRRRTADESAVLFGNLKMYSGMLFEDTRGEDGKWITSVKVGSSQYLSRAYSIWNGICSRARAGKSFQTRFKHYVGTTVCKEWEEDFQVFANWYTSQAGYAQGWHIDKDAITGEKHYSPEACTLLPRTVNLMFAPMNLRPYTQFLPKKDGVPRWRTADSAMFCDLALAKVRSKELKVARIDNLRTHYVPLGIPDHIFDRATSLTLQLH